MSSILSSLGQQPNARQALLEHARSLVPKWEKYGLLEGLDETYEKRRMAVLLENTADELLKEGSTTSAAAGSEEWSGVALPLVRRIFGSGIVSNEIMSVQPMNLPSGLIFYLDYQFGTAKGTKFGVDESVFGGSSNAKFGTTDSPEGGLYNLTRWDYSTNTTSSAIAEGDLASTGSATWAQVKYSTDLSASIAASEVLRVVINTSSLDNPDAEGARSFEISSSVVEAQLPTLTEFLPNTGQIAFYISASSAAVADGATITYSKQPVDFDRGDFEDKDGTNLNIPEIDIQLKSEPIVAKTKKLKAKWTPELVQDLNAYHSVDAEEELTNVLNDWVGLEIDLENLDMLYSRALFKDYWSAAVGTEVDENGNDITTTNIASANAYTKNSWFQTLGTKLQKVSNKIHQVTLRGGANFAVVSPDVATILESIPGFVADTDGNQDQFSSGVTQIGSIRNRMKIYKVPYITGNAKNVILLGFRGANFLETGAVYAPYVPVQMTPVVYDPDNFTPRKGLMTRYAKKMIKPEFYGLVIIRDLDKI